MKNLFQQNKNFKHKSSAGFITNIVIIIALVAVVFLSQQPYFEEAGKGLYFQADAQVRVYWEKASDWFKNNIYPRVSGEVEQKSAVIQEEITKQKNNIAQNIWGNIKNYFANIFSKTTGTPVQ